MPLGTAVWWRFVEGDPAAQGALVREFDSLTSENELKFHHVQPQRGEFDFRAADAMVGFARAHHMEVRGHTLVWGQQLPRWLVDPAVPWSREEVVAILRDHILTVVGRYRGLVREWDVVNEGISASGGYARNFWLEQIGPEYVALAFRWAREADPTARLFYNDLGIERVNAQSDAVVRLVARLQRQRVPIDGVGFQRHTFAGDATTVRDVARSMRRFTKRRLRVRITEMDAAVPQDATAAAFRAQARVYRRTAEACRRVRGCTGFTVWGIGDPFSWLGPEARPLLLDASYLGKPAYYAVREELPGR